MRHKDQVVGLPLVAHGDRSHDVLGAAAHGLPCIGAGWGPAPAGELAAAGSLAVAATPADVLALVRKMD